MSKKPSNQQYIGFISLLTTTFVYGFFGILVRSIGFNLPVNYQSLVRNIPNIIILLLVIYLKKSWKNLKLVDIPWIFFRTFLGYFAYITSYYAFNFIEIGTTYFLFFGGSTIGGYIIGKILFKEKITKVKLFSLFISLIGLLFIYSINVKPDTYFYLFISFVSGLLASAWNTFSKKISSNYSATQLNFIDTLFFVMICLISSIITNEKWIMPELNTAWTSSLLLSFSALVTGQLMIYGFKYLDAQIGSLIMLLEAVFGIVLAYIFYKETISIPTIIGGILILTAIILPELTRKSKK